MMFVLISLEGTGYISVRYDTASVTEFDVFARCLREGFDEVVAVGDAGASPEDETPRNGKARTSKATTKATAQSRTATAKKAM